MQTFDPSKQALVKRQRAFQQAKAEQQLTDIVTGLDGLTSGGLPVDPADIEDLVDSVVA